MKPPPDHVEKALQETSGGWSMAPESGRLFGAIFLGIFALVWNGGIWGVVLFEGSHLGWSVLIPVFFGIIGLGLLAFAAYAFAKALFTPQPQLILAAPVLTVGGATEIRWSIVGNVQRLANLAITLVAYEETEYTQGTTTTTDRKDIRTLVVWSADAPSAAGNARIEVPTDLGPTWRGRANRLRWKIVVKGRVAGLPDVDDSYPVTVVPATVHDNGSVIVAGPAVGDPPQGITLTTRPGNPGEAIAAQMRWHLIKAPGTFTLRFVWKATGKGGTEKGTIHGLSFPGKAEDGIAVAFVLPSFPPRHHGALVSVVYRLELLADERVIYSVDV